MENTLAQSFIDDESTRSTMELAELDELGLSEIRVLVAGFSNQDAQWALKWLAREQLTTQIVPNPDDAAQRCIDHPPAVLICPATATCSDNRPLFQYIREDLPFSDIACVTIVQNEDETQRALDHNVADITRTPINWSILSHRAKALADVSNVRRELQDTQVLMREAQRRASDVNLHLSSLNDVDQLTKLPTTHKFRNLVEGALSQKCDIAVLNIGIERFHLINDTHGREAGDKALVAVAERLRKLLLQSQLYAKDTPSVLAASVAKLNGVRFALFVPHNGTSDHLNTVRRMLTAELAKPVKIDNTNIYLSTSIGGAITPQHGDSASELINNAERAMIEVKRKGGGFSFHHQGGALSSSRQLELDGWLREAVDRRELKVAYQPLVNMWNNQIVGAEALLRWYRPDGTSISPGEFIPVAEMNGSVVEIGDYVIDTACAELRRWMDATQQNLRMAINLSVTQLRRGNVVRSLEHALQAHEIDPANLEMEISERGDIGSDHRIIRQLHEIKAIGVRLSLDDFGTGDTAIEYLKKLPIDILKLDRSYVSGALENGADSVITSALITLARNMNLTVIAEGIESKEQYELLRSWKCHLYQGFYCSPAVAGDEFLDLLANTPNLSTQEMIKS